MNSCLFSNKCFKFSCSRVILSFKRDAHSVSELSRAIPFENIPGPKKIPILGNIFRFLPVIGDFSKLDITELHVELNRRYGDIVKLDGIPGKPPLLFLSNAQDVAHVFHSEGEYPVRDAMQSTKYYRNKIKPEPYTRVGHLVDHGLQWKKFRTRVNQPMMKPNNIETYRDPIKRVTEDFVERIKHTRDPHCETGNQFMSELKKWALEVLGVVALDHRFGCLQDTLTEEAEAITKAVEDFHEATYSLDVQPFPLWKYVTTSNFKKMVSSLDCLHSLSEKYASVPELNKVDHRNRSILQELIQHKEDGRDVAVVLAVDMFLAGVEIIAGMAATLLYALSQHKTHQQWLFENVSSTSDKCAQPFLQAFIKESMRLWPVAIGTVRTAHQDMVLSGYRIPKGSMLMPCNYVMCRKPEYFKDPLAFNPARWLGSEKLGFSQYAFAPFGIGARSCIGRRIAMLELELFLLEVVRNFEINYNYGDMKFESKFLNIISSPLQFTFKDRTSGEQYQKSSEQKIQNN